jgi:ribosomal protein L11 methyltransferase
VPYRADLRNPGSHAFDRLIDLGAIDVELSQDGAIAAVMPDHVSPEQIAAAVGVDEVTISPAQGRDAGSVWILRPRPIQIGRLRIVPADHEPSSLDFARDKPLGFARDKPDTLRLVDADAFGTGLHPTTALCLEALDELVAIAPPEAVLDVGTGSGVLALSALMLGVPRALGIDIDDEALRVAGENARLNGLHDRLQLADGGPERVTGTWPLVVANVLAAPLIEMAPALVRCIGHHGHVVLSGIPASVEGDVDQAYRRLGLQRVRTLSRGGWVALVLRASW